MDPYEDPAAGLERVSSYNSLQASNRRRERERRVRLASDAAALPVRNMSTIDAHLSSQYESLDYEIVESELYRAEETNDKNFQVRFCVHFAVSTRANLVFAENALQNFDLSLDCLLSYRYLYSASRHIYRCSRFLFVKNQISPYNQLACV